MSNKIKAVFAAILLSLALLVPFAPNAVASGTFGVQVVGNQLVSTLDGTPKQLRGVNRSGTEYACTEGWGIFDGPATNAAINTMRDWGGHPNSINAVRVSLEEDCWLSTATTGYKGQPYRTAIVDYVNRLTAAGLVVIVDEHGHVVNNNNDQAPMPNRTKTTRFWGHDTTNNVPSVSETFQSNPAVIFDLFNEPYPANDNNNAAAWNCVANGGTCTGVNYQAAGMLELLSGVRATGATNVVMISGPQYAGVFDLPSTAGIEWLNYFQNADPLHQLAASIHIYFENASSPEYAPCYSTACWNSQIAPVAAQVPVVFGEIGELDCKFTLINGAYDGAAGQQSLVGWADAKPLGNVSYLAWAWAVASCKSNPALITNYNTGAPTNSYGSGYQAHLWSRAGI